MKTLGGVIATLLILAAGCVGAYELWNYYMYSPWTRDARVRADVVTIAPDVAGFVTDLRVKDNEFAHKGDILFILDQERYKLALATADANVASRQAEMLMRQSDAERRATITSGAISTESKEDAGHVAAAATAAYQEAVADQGTARLNLERTVIRAPVNGFVTNLTLVIGQYAAVGTKVMALIDADSYRVEGYFEETKLPVIKPEDRVEIYLMSGGPALQGHVVSISAGITDRDDTSGPELLANVTPTFEWVRLAQRIPVRIHIDDVPEGVRISSGMTSTVVVAAPVREWAITFLIRTTVSRIRNGFARPVPAADIE
jgi:multidrug resistance efflux pump